MQITFVPAQLPDMDELISMMRDLYIYDHSEFHEHTHRTALNELLANHDRGRVWLIKENELSVGYVVLTIGYSLEFHGRDGFLDELFIREPFRGQGIGTLAIAYVEEQARLLGIYALHLEVERANARAQQVYHTQGYASHTRYLMTKWLH